MFTASPRLRTPEPVDVLMLVRVIYISSINKMLCLPERVREKGEN